MNNETIERIINEWTYEYLVHENCKHPYDNHPGNRVFTIVPYIEKRDGKYCPNIGHSITLTYEEGTLVNDVNHAKVTDYLYKIINNCEAIYLNGHDVFKTDF